MGSGTSDDGNRSSTTFVGAGLGFRSGRRTARTSATEGSSHGPWPRPAGAGCGCSSAGWIRSRWAHRPPRGAPWDLWDAELTGRIVTTRGTVVFSAPVDRRDPTLLRAGTEGGERLPCTARPPTAARWYCAR
ncbi:hypothetical protein GCM10010420_15450 [Streptomyces glaucosporus]|uniref:Uncharacterized protein n=1 Tax=Streptomyces glaucosporus TaxID=284044 RepID=A0ABN3I0J0_9ACTN